MKAPRCILAALAVFSNLSPTSAENISLPDGRYIDVEQDYKYHLGEDQKDEANFEFISRQYILVEMRPNTALLCPRGYFIGKISQELFTNSNSTTYGGTVKKHSYSGGDEENKDVAPCPTIYSCLGMQACLFKYGNEFCRKDPAPNLRKMLLVTVTCQKDPPEAFLGTFIKPTYRKRDHVLHLRYTSRLEDRKFQMKRNYQLVRLFQNELEERVVFGGTCPPVRHAVMEQGYKGKCDEIHTDAEDITEKTWTLIGRTRSPSCRSELLQVFCAFQYNREGMCTPPFLLSKDAESGSQFNFRALPPVRERKEMASSHISIRPYSLNPVRLAFIFLWHKDITSAMELLHSIWRPRHLYVIHLDQKAEERRNILSQQLAEIPRYRANVFLLPESRSFPTAWGSYEIVRAEMEAIEELLGRGNWDFVINLSGSDLPLRNIDDLSAALAPHRGLNFLPFVEVQNKRKDELKTDQLSRKAFYSCDSYVFDVSETAGLPNFDQFEIYNSPQWGVFSRDFAEYLVDERRRSALINRFQFYLQTHVIPDESYIPSVLMNSPFRTFVRRYAVHASKEFESNNADHLCRHFTDADFCGQGPSLFESEDHKDLMSMSHRSFFARKFSGNLKDKTRAFALGLAKTGYSNFIATFLPRSIIWSLAIQALVHLASKDDRFLSHDLQLEEIKDFRILPALVPHQECCRSLSLSRLRKITDHRAWLDISFRDESEFMELYSVRVSMTPAINGRFCYKDGDLRMVFLSTWTKKFDSETETDSLNLGLQETMPLPYGPAGIRSVSLFLVFSRENFTCKDETAEYEENRPLYFREDLHELELILQLFSPTGEIVCDQRTKVNFTRENFSSEDDDENQFLVHPVVVACGTTFEAGPWTLQVMEHNEHMTPRIYNIPFYLLDFENESNIASVLEEVVHLWEIEEVALLPAESLEEDSNVALEEENDNHPLGIRNYSSLMFGMMACYGGVLASVACGIIIHFLLYVKRIRHQLLIRYVLLLSVASVFQAILLLSYC